MSLERAYFEAMYAADPDPWGFQSRWYEQRKYQLTLAALRRRRYPSGFEPGCSIGVLSQALAGRCDALLCTDPVPTAVEQTRTRLRNLGHVRVEVAALPTDWPFGDFDLIVLSEVLYYLDAAELTGTLDRARDSLASGGDLVVVHWRHPVPEYPATGDQVHAALARVDGLSTVASYRDADFALEVLTREPPAARSVAEQDGLWS